MQRLMQIKAPRWMRALLACWLLLCLTCVVRAQTAVYGPQTFDALTVGATPAGFAVVGTGTFQVSTYRPVSGANAAQISAGTVFAVYTTAPATTALDAFWNQTLSIGSGYYAESQVLFCDASATHGYLVTAAIYPPTTTYNLVISRYTTGVANAVQASTAAFPGNQFGGLTRNPQDGDHARLHAQLVTNNDGSITIRARLWEVGQTEPSSWENTYTDTSPVATTFYVGFAGAFAGSVPAGTYANVDDVTVTTLASASVPTPTHFADNAAFAYVGLHVLTGAGSQSQALAVNSGSGVEFAFSGATCSLCFNPLALTTFPEVEYEADGLGIQRTLVTNNGVVPLTLNTALTTHTIRAVWNSFEGSSTPDLWGAQANATLYLGVQLPSGGTLLSQGVNPSVIEFIGNSRTATYHSVSGSGTGTATYDVMRGWAFRTAARLGMRPVVNAHSGQGVVQNAGGGMAQGNFPVAPTSFGKVYSGQPYTLAPAVEVVSYTTNDRVQNVGAGTFQTAYAGLLAQVMAARPGAIIFCVVEPGDGVYSAAVANAASAANTTAGGTPRVYVLDYSGQTITTTDGLHYDLNEEVVYASQISSDIQSRLNILGIKDQSATSSTTVKVFKPSRQLPRSRN